MWEVVEGFHRLHLWILVRLDLRIWVVHRHEAVFLQALDVKGRHAVPFRLDLVVGLL